jgi:hypothetical protein
LQSLNGSDNRWFAGGDILVQTNSWNRPSKLWVCSSSDDADSSLNVARLANLPGEVIAVAGEKSRTMEEETKSREMQRWSFSPSEAG